MAKKRNTAATKGAASTAATSQPAANHAVLLGYAVAALQAGQPYFAPKDAMAGLISHPQFGQLVEFNEGMKDASGNIAFRATAKGVEVLNAGSLNGSAPPPAAPPQAWAQPGAPAFTPPPAPPAASPSQPAQPGRTFQFKKGVPIPTARRGGRGSNTYGFEQMEVGDAFDIAATADDPNPAKRVASTVSSASKRLDPKKFVVRSIDEGGVKLARVWRSA